MNRVVIKTPSGRYVGGERETQLVDRLSRAHVYEDGAGVDAQLAIVNTTYGWNWKKVDPEKEFDQILQGTAT